MRVSVKGVSTVLPLIHCLIANVTEVQMPIEAQSWTTFSVTRSHIKVIT